MITTNTRKQILKYPFAFQYQNIRGLGSEPPVGGVGDEAFLTQKKGKYQGENFF